MENQIQRSRDEKIIRFIEERQQKLNERTEKLLKKFQPINKPDEKSELKEEGDSNGED